MNPFGTTRQDTGGRNYRDELPPKRKWYDTVPFRPCRPPTPPWVMDWPLETRAVEHVSAFSQGQNCHNPAVLGDPGPGGGTGPLSAPGTVIQGPNYGQRTWAGRIRQAGTNLRSIQYSPMYQGPAILTEAAYNIFMGAVAPLGDSYQLGVVPGSGVSLFKVARTAAPIPASGYTLFDVTWISDNEQVSAGAGFMMQPEYIGQNGPVVIRPNMEIPWDTFSLWVLYDTASVNAGGIEWLLTFQPKNVTIGGSTLGGGPNQFNQGTYLGSGSRGF